MIFLNDKRYKKYVDTYFNINKLNENKEDIEIYFLQEKEYEKEIINKLNQIDAETVYNETESNGYTFFLNNIHYIYIKLSESLNYDIHVLFHELSHIFFEPDLTIFQNEEMTDEESNIAYYGYKFFIEFYADYYAFKTLIQTDLYKLKFIYDLDTFIQYTIDYTEIDVEDNEFNILYSYSSYLGLYEALKISKHQFHFDGSIIPFKTSSLFIEESFKNNKILSKLRSCVEFVLIYNNPIDLKLLLSLYKDCFSESEQFCIE